MSSPNQFPDGKSGVNRHGLGHRRFVVKFFLPFSFNLTLTLCGEEVDLLAESFVAHSVHRHVIRLVSERRPSEFPRRHHQFLVRCHGDKI